MAAMGLDELWSLWKRKNTKKYFDKTEEAQRRKQWTETANEVMHHNLKYDFSLVRYAKRLNKYADLSWQEFHNKYVGNLSTEQLLGSMSGDETDGMPFRRSEVTNVPEELEQLWPHWKRKHNKQYANENEEVQRRKLWMAQAKEVMLHNLKYDLGLVRYQMGLYHFSDQNQEEFRRRCGNYVSSEEFIEDMSKAGIFWKPFNRSEVTDVPEEVDWREHGLVREVKNQFQSQDLSNHLKNESGSVSGRLQNATSCTELDPQE